MQPPFEAWHEAGHAVIAHCLGGEVRLVTLETELDGHEGHTEVAWRDPARADVDRRSACVALAGPLAEVLLRDGGEGQDLLALSSWRGDWREAEACFERLAPEASEREQLRRSVVGEVRRMLDDVRVWEHVARVADALDAHGTLDRTLFEDTLG